MQCGSENPRKHKISCLLEILSPHILLVTSQPPSIVHSKLTQDPHRVEISFRHRPPQTCLKPYHLCNVRAQYFFFEQLDIYF